MPTRRRASASVLVCLLASVGPAASEAGSVRIPASRDATLIESATGALARRERLDRRIHDDGTARVHHPLHRGNDAIDLAVAGKG